LAKDTQTFEKNGSKQIVKEFWKDFQAKRHLPARQTEATQRLLEVSTVSDLTTGVPEIFVYLERSSPGIK